MPMAQYRMIAGEKWKLTWSFSSKQKALEHKKYLQSKGKRIRVQKIHGWYYIYTHVRMVKK